MIKAGILSDTHLSTVSDVFIQLVQRAFSSCDIIFHAGDLTNGAILEVFQDKTVHAVHGNMCNLITRQHYLEKKIVEIDGYTFGLCHGAGAMHNIEERMWTAFPKANCIIYGHTHRPLISTIGETLFINPGSFTCSLHGTPASYGILDIDKNGLQASLHTISPTR